MTCTMLLEIALRNCFELFFKPQTVNRGDQEESQIYLECLYSKGQQTTIFYLAIKDIC